MKINAINFAPQSFKGLKISKEAQEALANKAPIGTDVEEFTKRLKNIHTYSENHNCDIFYKTPKNNPDFIEATIQSKKDSSITAKVEPTKTGYVVENTNFDQKVCDRLISDVEQVYLRRELKGSMMDAISEFVDDSDNKSPVFPPFPDSKGRAIVKS